MASILKTCLGKCLREEAFLQNLPTFLHIPWVETWEVGDAEEAEEVTFLKCLEEDFQVAVVRHLASHLWDQEEGCTIQPEASKEDNSNNKTLGT